MIKFKFQQKNCLRLLVKCMQISKFFGFFSFSFDDNESYTLN